MTAASQSSASWSMPSLPFHLGCSRSSIDFGACARDTCFVLKRYTGPEAVRIAVLVGEAGAERAAIRRLVAHDRAGFLERVERGAAHVHRVEVVFSRARLGQDTVQQRLRPAGQNVDLEEGIFRLERG